MENIFEKCVKGLNKNILDIVNNDYTKQDLLINIIDYKQFEIKTFFKTPSKSIKNIDNIDFID